MNYLSLSRDSFHAWINAVGINSYQYEFSNRTYFISGEFYAIADKNEITQIMKIHGESWREYYSKYDDVLPFICVDEPKQKAPKIEEYKPMSKDVANFISRLKN